jgi:choline-sulfatase
VTRPGNLVVVMSDEHSGRHLGVAGHPVVRTPNIDRLAARGRRFTAAHTPSPICVPARASIATGQWVHRIGHWDNALAYDGRIPGWGHRLQAAGIRVESIGKLHYRDADLPTGFDRQHVPMHLAGGTGMIWASVRDPLPDIDHRSKPRMIGERVGPGESSYTAFDRTTARLATDWLEDAATRGDGPFVLFVGFVAPHFPLVAPPEFAAMYPVDRVPPFKLRPADGHARHPWVEAMDAFWPHDAGFRDEDERRLAVAMYWALCSYVDHHLGLIVETLERTGLAADTRLIYASDHGDNLGARGLWGKSTLYRESVEVPLIVAGPGIPAETVTAPVSLVDLHPTVLEGVGIPTDPDKPGRSLLSCPFDEARAVFSEYHAVGAPSGAYMVRKGRWKYHHYVGHPPELFDLATDPEETRNLADRPDLTETMRAMRAALDAICDPDAVDARAKADQAALVARYGGREAALGVGNVGATPPPTVS